MRPPVHEREISPFTSARLARPWVRYLRRGTTRPRSRSWDWSNRSACTRGPTSRGEKPRQVCSSISSPYAIARGCTRRWGIRAPWNSGRPTGRRTKTARRRHRRCQWNREEIQIRDVSNANRSVNALHSKFYVCPVCGNVLSVTGGAVVSR